MHRPLVIPLGLSVLTALGACVADTGDGGIFVLRNIHPDGSTCVTTGLETQAGRAHGQLDVDVSAIYDSGYLFIAQMKSRITALTGQEDQRTIITSGAKVDITFPGSTVFSAAELADLKTRGLTHFQSAFAAPIKPNGGVTDAGFTLIPAALATAIGAKATGGQRLTVEALATFTVEGTMAGGTVTSQEFSYPVTIGNGQTASIISRTCPVAKGTVVRGGYVCNPAQDGVVDCCVTNTGELQCPAEVSTM